MNGFKKEKSWIENILFSHAYEPWNSDAALGRKRVLECIEECLNYLK